MHAFLAQSRHAATFVSWFFGAFHFVGSFVAVGGFCGHRRGTPVSSTLVSWSPGSSHLDDLTLVWCKVRSEDPSVGLTIEIVLDQDRWCLDFQGLTDYSDFSVVVFSK